ncbi:hypothetical protein O1611_g3616 [Lasiodiplodia mahajangana]|uniref:Uncharacterized protein n=1 Tax=Lasiodiplodia mahajangana TaxID=1108764 RepID=A0ACC2JRE9_9PEZI|nr:hypothetical protein O1611_g3616 [Lasiodiplodia mahajangana]
MFTRTLLISLPAALALRGGPPDNPFLLPCSSISGTPCRCPYGTDYSETVTTAIVGASAGDVGSVTGDFFNPAWLGLDLISVQGPDNFPALSIRNVNMTTSIGTYTFSDRLVFRFLYPDGSFEQRYEQIGIASYRYTNGSFSGYWVTLKGDRIFENETLLRLSNYACQTERPIDYIAFQEMALSNVTSILTARGVATGLSTTPASAGLF